MCPENFLDLNRFQSQSARGIRFATTGGPSPRCLVNVQENTPFPAPSEGMRFFYEVRLDHETPKRRSDESPTSYHSSAGVIDYAERTESNAWRKRRLGD